MPSFKTPNDHQMPRRRISLRGSVLARIVVFAVLVGLIYVQGWLRHTAEVREVHGPARSKSQPAVYPSSHRDAPDSTRSDNGTDNGGVSHRTSSGPKKTGSPSETGAGGSSGNSGSGRAPNPPHGEETAPRTDASAGSQPHSSDIKPVEVSGITIRDREKGIVFQGTVNLQPTLDRIAAGRHLEHRNDGTVFGNREKRLPRKPKGYYREYVHPTPGLRGPGPQRLVIGEEGEVYYTPDHYRTFRRVQ
jgi:guanyl-specific ribonuclease Sa